MCCISGCMSPKGITVSTWNYIQKEALATKDTYLDKNCALIHTTPFTLGQRTIVFSGALYDTEYPELSGKSPEEIILRAWEADGESCLSRLNGAFSFVIYDRQAQRIFFARDPMGVKSLFYCQKGGSLYFSTDLTSLLCFPEIEPLIDARGLYDLMFLGPGRTPGFGVYCDVYELKPGQWGCFDETGLQLFTYWSLKDSPCSESFSEITEKVRDLIESSIRRQLKTDLPVAAFLSGGLDSSIVSAVAAKELGGLEVYSLEYTGNDRYFSATKFQPTSDTDYMYLMADHIGAHTNRVEVDTEPLISALYEAAEARGLPGMADVDSSMLLLCRAAGDRPRVVLSGECADEFFGGYPWYRDPDIRSRAGFPWAQTTDYRASFLRPEFKRWMEPQEFVSRRYDETLANVDLIPDQNPTDKRTKEMFVLNFTWFMQTLLARNDRMSACSAVTLRAPFCDKNIAQYLYTVPWPKKEHMGMEKGLLRHAFRDLLPDQILHRKKSPFPKTWNPKYMEGVSALLRDELSGTTSPLLEFLDKDALLKLCSENRSIPWYGQLMTTPQTIAYFLQMAHWMRINRVGIKY